MTHWLIALGNSVHDYTDSEEYASRVTRIYNDGCDLIDCDTIESFLEKHMYAYTRMVLEDSDSRYNELKRRGLV